VAGGRRRLHSEELHNVYASASIIQIIKLRRIILAEYVAHVGDKRNTYNMLANLKGRDHLEDLGVDGRIILEWILGKQGGKVWAGCIWLRIMTSVRF
jgi:hypothetical protein